MQWLEQTSKEHWSSVYFKDSCLCDLLHNNISESFNNFSSEARDKLIITCLEMLRRQLMVRFEEKRRATEKCNSILSADHEEVKDEM